MANVVMRSRDVLSARLAECYVTINDNRYNFMQAINFEAKFEKIKNEVPILGKIGSGNRSTGWKGTGKATFYFNTSIFRETFRSFKNTGEDLYFDIQVTNEDPTSLAGRQTIVFVDCNIDTGVLAKFDASGTYLEEDMTFTFEDFKISESFDLLTSML